MKLQDRNLSLRMKGADVKLLLSELIELGYTIPQNELSQHLFGRGTRKAVIDFQKKHKLEPSGAVDQRTAIAINAAVEALQPRRAPTVLMGTGVSPAEPSTTATPDLSPAAPDLPVSPRPLETLTSAPPTEEPSYKVSGRVVNKFGEPISGKKVFVFDLDLKGAGIYKQVERVSQLLRSGGFEQLGVTTSDAKGYYEVRFGLKSFSRSERGLADVVAYAVEEDIILGRSTLATKKDYVKGIEIQNLDIILTKSDERGISEYHSLLQQVAPLLKSDQLELHQLTKEQVFFLAQETEQPPNLVSLLVQADQLRAEYPGEKLSLEMLYGLGRQKVVLTWSSLSTKSEKELKSALQQSIQANIISQQKEDGIRNFLKQLAKIASLHMITKITDSEDEIVGKTLKIALEDDKQRVGFLNLYRNFEGPLEKFWREELPKQPEFRNNPQLIRSLQLTNQLAVLTGQHPPLMEELQVKRGIKDVKDLLSLPLEEWQKIIQKTGVPGTGLLATDGEKTRYIENMQNLLHAAYPTETISLMVKNKTLDFKDANITQSISAFLDQAKDFDISKSNINDEKYTSVLQTVAGNKFKESKIQLEALQRVYQVSPTPKAMAELIKSGVTSAYQIASIPEQTFLAKYSSSLGEAQAKTIYDRGTYQAVRIQNVAMTLHEALLSAVPQATTYSTHRNPTLPEAVKKHIPNWEELFGRADLCECQHCSSVYSPAAYFVDLLRFLEKSELDRSPLEVLVSRRPDLAYIPLTCENTKTIIPYIDLVNEVLEYYVTNNKLDEDAAHDVGDATMAELRANPQHTMTAPYQKLKDAVYPFNLPYHQPLDVIRTHLQHLKTSRAELMEVFRTESSLGIARAIQAENLNLSEEEYKILTGKDFNDANDTRNVWEYFGYNNFDELRDQLTKVPQFLKRTGIAYTDLVELVKTKFINPYQTTLDYIESLFNDRDIDPTSLYKKLQQIKAGTLLPQNDEQIKQALDASTDPNPYPYQDFVTWINTNFEKLQLVITLWEPQSGCDLASTNLFSIKSIYEKPPAEKLPIPDLPSDTFSKIHRFIRLWRKTGWAMQELDNLIGALGETDITPAFIEKLAYVKKINGKIKLQSSQLACLWGVIDTYGKKSLYARLFLNKAVQRIDKVFQPDQFGKYLQDKTQTINGIDKEKSHLPAVLAAFRLSEEQLGSIAEDSQLDLSSALLTIENLSIIYRYVVLAKALKLSINDLCALRSLFGAQPFSQWNENVTPPRFENIRPDKTLEFMDLVQKAKASGFKVPVLKYILSRDIDHTANFALKNEKIWQAMKSIRDGLLIVEQEHPEDEQVTEELIQKKLSLIFNQDVATQFTAMLKGDLIYSTLTATNLEIVIPDNLKEKITYIKATGRLQCKGVLTDDERATLENLAGATTSFKEAVQRIYQKPEQFIKDHFRGVFTNLEDAYRQLLDHPTQPPPKLTLEQKLEQFYKAFLPFLKERLRQNIVIQSVAVAIGLDEPMTEVLLRDQVTNIIEAVSKMGLSARYYKDTTFIDLGIERIDPEISFAWENAPDNLVPADQFSVLWEAWVGPTTPGDYTFIADVEQIDESIEVWLEHQKLFEKAAGESTLSKEGVSTLNVGKMHHLQVKYIEGTGKAGVHLYWQTDRIPKEIVPAQLLYPASEVDWFSDILGKLHRAALFINGFKLNLSELAHIHTYSANFDNFDIMAISASHWKRICEFARLRKAVPQNIISLIQIFEAANDLNPIPSLSAFLELVAFATNWDLEQLSLLSDPAHFNLNVADFRNEILLLRLYEALKLTNLTGISAEMLSQWASPQTDFVQLEETAQLVKRTIKVKYEEETWLEVAKGLSDKIRENQKQALISYLLQQKPLQDWGAEDADGLFEYFLIDVQMDACMDTSRIKQAISSVQLFVNRCLLNLESEQNGNGQEVGVSPKSIDDRWEWMKNYRVWEANRKIFLYPENWLEPELRDDKSPFFKELESELLQNDITDQTVEGAFRSYLSKLNDVSNLEVCGLYQDMGTQWLHIFARTHASPYQYYYRIRNEHRRWSAWEKVQLDIRSVEDGENSGAHLIPVVWKSRLFLFWPEFMKKQKEKELSDNDTDLTSLKVKDLDLGKPYEYWEIRLAWSEYKDGKWTPKQVSKEFIKTPETEGAPLPKTYRFDAKIDASNQLTIKALSEVAQILRRPGSFSLADIQSKVRVTQPSFAIIDAVEATIGAVEVGRLLFEGATINELIETGLAFDVDLPFPGGTTVEGFDFQPLPPSEKYATFYMAFDRTNELNLKGKNYLQDSRYHRILYSHQHADFQTTLNYPFFYQDNFRSYFVEPVVIQHINTLKNPDTARFYAIDLVTVRNRVGSMPRTMVEVAVGTSNPTNVGLMVNTVPNPPRRTTSPDVTRGDIAISLARTTSFSMTTSRRGSSPFGGGYSPNLHDSPIMRDRISVVKDSGLKFYTFFHPYAGDFITQLNQGGIQQLIDSDTAKDPVSELFIFPDDDGELFERVYVPNTTNNLVQTPFPRIKIDFGDLDENTNVYQYGAYSLYNWELFFHIPLFIATRLSRNGKYAEAMKWFHYIFDPTTNEPPTPNNPNARYWKVPPFKEAPEESIEDFFRTLQPNVENPLISEWRDNPFKPHLIARGRPLAYMKNVIIHYIDNLIAWGDELFRRDTIESINEAIQIYVIAAHILGPRPQLVPKRGEIKAETYNSLQPKLDAFSNALVQLENIFPYSSEIPEPTVPYNGSLLGIGTALYFCIPNNDQLLKSWDTVADRLFKVRHCMNIEGVERRLPLFEPPIEPGLLVAAVAKGISLASILSDLNSPAPFYRFNYLSQKASEVCSEVKSLGASLLSAIEKRDAEELSRLRAAHETRLLEMIKAIKERQLLEAKANKQSLDKNRETAKKRLQHYSGLLGIQESDFPIPDTPQVPTDLNADSELPADTIIQDITPDVDVSLVDGGERGVKVIPKEKEDIDKSQQSKWWQTGGSTGEALAGIFHLFPKLNTHGTPMGVGVAAGWGGQNLGAATSALAKVSLIYGQFLSHEASQASKMASFIRREQDWILQANMASREIIQLDKQLIAAEIRIQISQKELENHLQQIEHAQQIELFLKGESVDGYIKKFSTTELYQWMKEQLFAVYKQCYQLAYDMAKKAEKAYRFELGQPNANFIQYGYWDSTYEGLTAGEKLYYALRQMEKSYLEENRRELELTKPVSLAMLNPLALIELKQTGSCVIDLPEELFDLDYSGHYFRRIKSASITIPCIIGPYATVNCTLRLLKNSIRINTFSGDSGYERNNDDGVPIDDPRFVEQNIPFKTIATSSAQNDGGVFELSFRDERYLPFEGAGAISQWKLELNGKTKMQNGEIKDFAQFDYDSISDIILHLQYTAREDAGKFRQDAANHLEDFLKKYIDSAPNPLWRIIDLKREFSTQWHKFLHPTPLTANNVLTLEMKKELFPFLAQKRAIQINQIVVLAKCIDGTYNVSIDLPDPAADVTLPLVLQEEKYGELYAGSKKEGIDYAVESPANWNISMKKNGNNLTSEDVEDVILVLGYQFI